MVKELFIEKMAEYTKESGKMMKWQEREDQLQKKEICNIYFYSSKCLSCSFKNRYEGDFFNE